MNLAKTLGTRFHVRCVGCGTSYVPAGEGTDTYADLDGEPFIAYYCGMCARIADPEYALTRVTDYLTGEVARAMRGLDPAVGPQRNRRQRIYDATDAAVIITARRADMALERQRGNRG